MNTLGKLAVVTLVSLSGAVMTSVQAADAAKEHDHEHQAEAKAGGMMGDMKGDMKKMEDEMAAIMNEKDPAKRKELMEKHMSGMHEHMQQMMGMMKGSNDKDMASRMQMMEERMDKMEKEMHGGMMGKSAPAKPQDAKPAAPAQHQH